MRFSSRIEHTNARPRIETLEDRTLLSVCNVNRLSDNGQGKGFRGDLRYCITRTEDLPGDDVIIFPVVTGTINLTSALPDLGDNLVIAGPGADKLTVRSAAGGDYRLFTIAGGSVQIYNLTLAGGNGDVGGGIYNQATLTLGEVVVTDNESRAGVGGGIYNAGNLVVVDSTISNNRSRGLNIAYGAGIYNEGGGTLTVLSSTVSGNVADPRCTGSQCLNDVAGGGVFNAGGATLTVELSSIAGNSAQSPSLTNSVDTVRGGGIFNAGSTTVSSSTVSGNLAVIGGAGADTRGGGIFNEGPDLTLDNSTIANNSLTSLGSSGFARGAGLYIAGGVLASNHTTIAYNLASNPAGTFCVKEGGGIAIGDGAVNLRNTILAKNAFSGTGPKIGPDLNGALDSSGYNLIGNGSGGSGYDVTDILDVDPMLGSLADNGGATFTIALLPGSPAIDAGDNTDAPEWDQRGPGFVRIVDGAIDIGAFEVQGTAAPSISRPRHLAQTDALILRLATPDLDVLK